MIRWDAATYDRVADPLAAMGASVLEWLPLAGGERVLDAGCGSGRVTEMLAQRLPRGEVVALDASPEMLAEAHERLARFGERVRLVQADLGRPPLPIDGQVDAVLSTATLHWVLDQEALFRGLSAVLRPGGRLAAQCGGTGNCATVFAALRVEGVEATGRLRCLGVDETSARLRAAGFEVVDTWLQPEPVSFGTRGALVDYLVTVFVRPLSDLPETAIRPTAERVADHLDGPVIDYVRLSLTARRR